MRKSLILLPLLLFIATNTPALELRTAQNIHRCLNIYQADAQQWRYLKNVELFACNKLDTQEIKVLPRGEVDGRLSFVLRLLGRCLEVDQIPTRPWTALVNVQLGACRGAPHQRWFIESAGPNWQRIKSVVDGRCLEIDTNPAHGWIYNNNLQVGECSGGVNQLWFFDD